MSDSTANNNQKNGLSPGLLQMLRAKRQQQKAQTASANLASVKPDNAQNNAAVNRPQGMGRGRGGSRGRGRGRGRGAGRGNGSPSLASNGAASDTQSASEGPKKNTMAERIALLQAKIARQLSATGTTVIKDISTSQINADEPATPVANADSVKTSVSEPGSKSPGLASNVSALPTQSAHGSAAKASTREERLALLQAKLATQLSKPAVSKLAALEAKLAAKLPSMVSSKRSQPEGKVEQLPAKRPRLEGGTTQPAMMQPRSLTSSITTKKRRVGKREQPQLSEAEIAAQKKKDKEESYNRMQLLNEAVGLRDEYKLIKGLGQGRFGVVSLVEHKKTKVRLAIKELKYDFNEKSGFPIEALRELTVLAALQQQTGHKNVVAIREIVSGADLGCWYLVMEYCEYDMDRLLQYARSGTPFSSAQVKSIMLQLFEGLRVMHDHWYVHRDIKVQNILLDSNGVVKYCDFGCARRFGPGTLLTPGMVSGHYRAPELLLRVDNYDTAVDVWAVGCIFGELLARCVLFPGKSEIDQIQRVTQLLGTPSEEEWPGFAKRAAKVGLRIEATATAVKKDKMPRAAPTPDKNAPKPKPKPKEDDPLESFMAQIESKPESSDQHDAMDVEVSEKSSQKDDSDKEVVLDIKDKDDVKDKDASTEASGSPVVADNVPSTSLPSAPERTESKLAEMLSADNTSVVPDTNTNTTTPKSREPGTASLHAARVECAATRHKLRKAFPEDGYDPIHIHAANFRTTALTHAGFELLSSCLMFNPKTRISAEEAAAHRWFTTAPLPKKLTLQELTQMKTRHQRAEEKAKKAEAAKVAASAIERAKRMALAISRGRRALRPNVAGMRSTVATPPGVIVYPPRPLITPTVPALQTNLNIALQQQMIIARTQQIQRHIANAADRAKKEASAKAAMMAKIMSLRNS